MSASTGGGHNRAAKAMKDEIEKKCIDGEHITCEIRQFKNCKWNHG